MLGNGDMSNRASLRRRQARRSGNGDGATTRPGRLRVEVPRVSERGVQLREGEEGEVDGCRRVATIQQYFELCTILITTTGAPTVNTSGIVVLDISTYVHICTIRD